MHTIYGLFDPRNGQIKYIGRTRNVEQRFKSHCNSNDTNKVKNDWIKELKDNGFLPEMQEIDIASDLDVVELEDFYIGYFKMLGATLTNGHGYNPRLIINKTKKEAIIVRVDPAILVRIDEAARKRGISRAAWINSACTRTLDLEND